MASKANYGNESIQMLKGADRVRLRPAVIFGSDNLEGCIHSFFEILSNSIDEAREGYGNQIFITRFADGTIEVEDYGRGIPLDYNTKEQRFNWELVYCELYAASITTILRETTSSRLALTVSVHVLPSMRPNSSMLRYSATRQSIRCHSRRVIP